MIVTENAPPPRPVYLTIRVWRDHDEKGQTLEAFVEAAMLVPALLPLDQFTRSLGVHLRVDDLHGEEHIVTLAPYDEGGQA